MPIVALIRSALGKTVGAYHERHAREARVLRDVAYLKSFDDRLLSDIGLTRSEIEAYVRRRLGPSRAARLESALRSTRFS